MDGFRDAIEWPRLPKECGASGDGADVSEGMGWITSLFLVSKDRSRLREGHFVIEVPPHTDLEVCVIVLGGPSLTVMKESTVQ